MAIGSGLGGQVMAVPEVTYGTFVAPTKSLEVQSSTLKKTKNTVQGGGIAAGRLVQLGSRRRFTTEGVEGELNFEVVNKGMGIFLQALMGTSVTPVIIAAGPGYTQTHILADNLGKNLTIQNGVPQLDGTVKAFSALGCKVTSGTFACGIDETLTASYSIVGRKMDEAQTLGTASYVVTRPFAFADSTFKIGASFGAEAAVQGVRGASVTIARSAREDRFYQGNAGLRSEPISNDFVSITGSVDVDFIDKTVFNDRFAADTAFSVVWEFLGTAFTGGVETFRITLPNCYFDGDGPTLDGPDIVTGSFPFTAQFDGTNPACTITHLSQEAAL